MTDFGGFGGLGDLLGGLPKEPLKPHDWDYSKNPYECRACKISWEANAGPTQVKDYITPTCTGNPLSRLFK